MIRKIAMLVCAILFSLSMAVPAFAAGQFYPFSVEEYTEGNAPRIKKIYQLSPEDDPAGIPSEDFERDGRLYYLMDIIRTDNMGVDVQPHTETVTLDSDTGEMSEILKRLDAEMEITTEDGHTGVLALDHTSVTVEAKGYKTSTRNVSATRTYPNLSDADLSLIPTTIEDGGKTLTLADVQWSGDGLTYTATVSYTGTASSSYATGYTVTASYIGEVAKTNCETVLYTAIFGGMEIPQEEPPEELEPEREPESEPEQKPEEKPPEKDVQEQPIVLGENRTRLLMIAAMIGCLLVLIPILLKSAKGKKRNSAKGKRRYD